VEDKPLTLALLDIDHFKNVNDRYGHKAGDLVLKNVAAMFEEVKRPDHNDYAYRYGGEEFCLLFPNTTIEEAMPLLEAFPDETQIMKYKLTTLPRGTARLPILDLGYAAVRLKQGASLAITPQTLNYLGSSQAFESSGYTATIADARVLNSFNGVGINTPEATAKIPRSTETPFFHLSGACTKK
jgi:GGDEF domain-containing protein